MTEVGSFDVRCVGEVGVVINDLCNGSRVLMARELANQGQCR